MAFVGQSVKAKRVRYTPQSSIPANPLEGDVYYSDGTASAEGLYVYSNGSWVPVGSAGGQINYIDGNADAESSITGYSTYDDGASAIPVDGTGGTAANLTFSRNTTTPLRGIADFDLAKAAADAQGEGVSYDFTIDNADKNSILRISFDYTVSSAYADDDIGVFVYDVTNSQLVRFAGEELKASSLTAKYIAEFQATDSVSYRLCVHVKTTNASAYSLNFDNVSVGPREVAKGPVVIDYKDFSGVFRGTTTDPTKGASALTSFKYQRIGDSAEVIVQYNDNGTTGASGTGTYYIDISDIGSVDLEKAASITATSSLINQVGDGIWTSGLGTNFNMIIHLNPTNGRIEATLDQINGNSAGQWGASFGAFGNANTDFSFRFRVPIQGWSSNATISTDLGNREISLRAEGNSAAAITANTEQIDFTSVADSTASWVQRGPNGADTFVVPETGWYSVAGMVRQSTSTAGVPLLFVNGAKKRDLSENTTGITAFQKPFAFIEYFVKGDEFDIRMDVGFTLQNTISNHYINIYKLSSPQTLLTSDKVLVRGAGNGGGSITANVTNIDFTEIEDNFGAFDGTTFTAPRTGDYLVTGSNYTTIGSNATLRVYINNTVSVSIGTAGGTRAVGFTGIISLNKGDTLTVRSDTTITLTNDNSYHNITIRSL